MNKDSKNIRFWQEKTEGPFQSSDQAKWTKKQGADLYLTVGKAGSAYRNLRSTSHVDLRDGADPLPVFRAALK